MPAVGDLLLRSAVFQMLAGKRPLPELAERVGIFVIEIRLSGLPH
jgi:hypothetical protein